MNTLLLKLVKGYSGSTGPFGNTLVTLIGPVVPGLLMSIDRRDIILLCQTLQYINSLANANDKRLAKARQGDI